MITVDTIQWYLKEASTLRVKEFYLTGGEPFLHPQIVDIIKETLNFGTTTILSNGILITQKVAQEFNQISRISKYKLAFRYYGKQPNGRCFSAFYHNCSDDFVACGSFSCRLKISYKISDSSIA